MTTNKGGKPQKTLTPEQVLEVGTLSAFLSQEQIADYFGIARNTFIAICERQPEVFEQYKKGKARAIGTVAKGLIKQAMEGNTSAAMFYLKTQAGWRETSVQEITGKDGAAIEIKQTTDLTDDELKAELAKYGITEQLPKT